MYLEDDTLTPRDRISDNMLRRMLDDTDNCGGGCNGNGNTTKPTRSSWGLKDHPLASVYAPLQVFRNLYDRETALQKGTLFSELDLPFMGESVMKGGKYRG